MQTLSIEEWAKREGVSTRKAYRWAKTGKVATAIRKIEVKGIPANITKDDLCK